MIVSTTASSIYNTLQLGISKQMQLQLDSSQQISTGKRFFQPVNDPVGYKASLDIRHMQSGLKATLSGIGEAQLQLGVTSNALAQMVPIMQRIEVLAVQQANGNLQAKDRLTAATEVSALQNQLVNLTNTTLKGQSVFSGTATNTTPITLNAQGVAVYQGSTQDRTVAITATQRVISNVRADHPAFTQMFATVKALKDALTTNNTAAISQVVSQSSNATQAIAGLNADVGSRLSALQIRQTTILDMQASIQNQLNQQEGVDIAAVAMKLAQAQTTLQTTYSQVSKFSKMSLVNFLR